MKLVVSRAAELVEAAVASTTRTSEAAVVREAARVLRRRAIIFGSGVWFPPGFVVHLSAVDHQRLSPMFNTARGTVGARVAARLRTPDGEVPQVRVIFDLDPQLPSGFAVSALERTDAPARLTVVKGVGEAPRDAAGYPYLVWADGRRLEVDPAGVDLGREVVGPGRTNDPTVSARHAVIALESGGVRVTDVGSTNGTWVNGTRISDAVLHHGDTMRIGSSTLRLDWPASQATALLPEDDNGRRSTASAMWEVLVAQVPTGHDRLQWLTEATGVSFRALDRVRRLQSAAPGAQRMAATDLDWAIEVLSTATAALQQGGATA